MLQIAIYWLCRGLVCRENEDHFSDRNMEIKHFLVRFSHDCFLRTPVVDLSLQMKGVLFHKFHASTFCFTRAQPFMSLKFPHGILIFS